MMSSRATDPRPSIQVLLEQDQSLRLLVAERPVGLMADGVPQFGIGSHLAATPRPCPRFSRLNQCPTHAPTPHVPIDVPPLDVPHGPRLAADRPGSDRRLHKAA